MRRSTLTALMAAAAISLTVAACSSSSSSQTMPAGSATTQQPETVALSTLRDGHYLCAEYGLDLFRTPAGVIYSDASLDYPSIIDPGAKCSGAVVWRDKTGVLNYKGSSKQVEIHAVQPLVTDSSKTATGDLYLTQNLTSELSPGVMRYVDTAAIESDPGGYVLLAGFPTAAHRFYGYYAGLSVVGGKVQVCLPSYNQVGVLGSSGNSADIRVRVGLDGQDCHLPASGSRPYHVSLSQTALHQSIYGECSNLAIGPGGQYFDQTGSYYTQVGMPGYSSWPLHVKITKTTAGAYKVVVIDEGSCLPFEAAIIPIRQG